MLQESLEKGYKADYPANYPTVPTNDGGIHPDYRQALHNLLSTYVEVGLGVKGESEVPAQRPSNFVAAILRCLMHLWLLPRPGPPDGTMASVCNTVTVGKGSGSPTAGSFPSNWTRNPPGAGVVRSPRARLALPV